MRAVADAQRSEQSLGQSLLIGHCCLQLKQVETYNGCLIRRAETQHKDNKVSHVLDILFRRNGDDRDEDIVDHLVNLILIELESQQAYELPQGVVVGIPHPSEDFPSELLMFAVIDAGGE